MIGCGRRTSAAGSGSERAANSPAHLCRMNHQSRNTTMAEHLPEHRTAFIAGAGHMDPLSDADDVHDLVRTHLWAQITGQIDSQRIGAIGALCMALQPAIVSSHREG